MTTVELREKRAGVISEARKIWDEAQKREGGPTAEDQQAFDRLMADANRLKDQYTRAEQLEAEERELDQPGERRSSPIPEGGPTGGRGRKMTPAEYRASEAYHGVWRNWLADGREALLDVPGEYRDTILGTDSKGGFLVTPTRVADTIVKQVNDLVFIRQLATVYTLTDAKALRLPVLTTRMADAQWTTEVASVTEDTTMAFGNVDLTPSILTKLSKVSMTQLGRSPNTEQFIMDELAYKYAITEEKGYLTGSGSSNQPLGIFTASASGIPTGRDVSTGNTTTALGVQNIYELKYSLKAGYRNDPSCRWLWGRTAVNQIMQFKDSQNRYLWEPSLQAGQPDRLLNIPVAESEYVPATFTTGLYVGAIGAMRYYAIAEVPNEFSMQRLVERYADTNEVGFIARRWLAGNPALGEAFSRAKLA